MKPVIEEEIYVNMEQDQEQGQIDWSEYVAET